MRDWTIAIALLKVSLDFVFVFVNIVDSIWRHSMYVAADHNELLRHAAALEKMLPTATKNRDEAIAALEESRKREEDLRVSTVERETLFEEQLFSIAKSLSGLLFHLDMPCSFVL